MSSLLLTFSVLPLLAGRQERHPAWGSGVVICLERGADLHMAQLMPLPLTVSCFSNIQIGFTFLVPAQPGSPGKRAVKWVCVCVCVCSLLWEMFSFVTKHTNISDHYKLLYGELVSSSTCTIAVLPIMFWQLRPSTGALSLSLYYHCYLYRTACSHCVHEQLPCF